MKKELEFLKKDRRVTKTFMEKLEKVGIEIFYGNYNYWDSQEYVRIGREQVWLVESSYSGNNQGLKYRYQNDVIEEIENVIAQEYSLAANADAQVENFFRKLSAE
jgi:hypothetical protein